MPGMGEGPNGAASMPRKRLYGVGACRLGVEEIPSHPGRGLLKAGGGLLGGC
jgi:hypothetical protein